MDPLVRVSFILLAERGHTVLALVQELVPVDRVHVLLEPALLGEPRVALGARVALYARVRDQVLLERALVHERLAARLAHVRPDVEARLVVVLERVGFGVRLAAVFALRRVAVQGLPDLAVLVHDRLRPRHEVGPQQGLLDRAVVFCWPLFLRQV